MFVVPRRLSAVAVALLAGAAPVAAQIDYRNLDGHRPLRVTDANPVERFAFELSLPYRFERRDEVSFHSVAPHLEYGIARNVMVGLGLEVGNHAEIGEASLGAFWNIRRETAGMPALSLSVDVAQPFDRGVGGAARGDVGLLATRSVGRNRVHLNGAIRLGGAANLYPATGSGAHAVGWWAGLALDRTLFRSSTIIVAEGYAERDRWSGAADWFVGIGARRQVSPTIVLHLGLEQQVDEGSDGTELTIGFSHAFGIAGLFPGGRR